MTTGSAKKKEPIYFYLTGNWYKGKMPSFYSKEAVSKLKSTQILEGNYEKIKEEVLDFYENKSHILKPNYATSGYVDTGWLNFSLHAFMLKFPAHIKHLPFLGGLLKEIPGIMTAQVAILHPGRRIKAHFGDTNAIIRSHLGLVVPGDLPDIGFRNKSEEQCWKEGEVLAICIANRHYVWNYTDKMRIVLIVDTIHPDYKSKKYYIGAGLIASSIMKIITTKFPKTRKAPNWFTVAFHKLLIPPIIVALLIQNKLKVDIGAIFMKLK